jgi:hypothetical protein
MQTFNLRESSFCIAYLEGSVIESVVLSVLEEVGVAVAVLQGVVNVVWNPLPVRDRPALFRAFEIVILSIQEAEK